MKSLLIAGTWKSYKRIGDFVEWFDAFGKLFASHKGTWEHITIVLCPPYTLLSHCADRIQKDTLPLALGAQDVSPFTEGAFTGEINAHQIAEFAQWSIIGHSERRRNLGETDALLLQKVTRAKETGLKIIYCVQDEATSVPEGVSVIAYEPPWAISAVSDWKAQDPASANRVCEKIAKKYPNVPIIYGGSSSPENITAFLTQPAISGVLSGGASLDPKKFFDMIASASTL